MAGGDTRSFTSPDTSFTDRGLDWMACRHRDQQSGSRAISLSGQDKQILHSRVRPVNSTGIFPFARVRRIGVLATEMKSRFVLVTQWRRGGRDQFHEQSGCEQRRSDNQERHHARTESTRSATNGRWENRLSRGNDCPHSGVGVSGWDRNERRTSVDYAAVRAEAHVLMAASSPQDAAASENHRDFVDDVRTTKVLLTMLGGRIVWEPK